MSAIETSATCILLGCKERRSFQMQGLGSLKASLVIVLTAYLREDKGYP